MYGSFKLQAYALVLLRKDGHPWVFPSPLSHSASHASSVRCAFYGDLYPNEECYDDKISDGLKVLLRARKKFAYGIQRDHFHEKNCIGFVREGDDSHAGCVVLVSNADSDNG